MEKVLVLSVRNALIKISIMDTIELHTSVSNPKYLHDSNIICPMEQIRPPTQKLLKQFLKIGEFGDFLLT